MASMMDQLTTDVTKNVISQITGKLLPAIADRYDIPLDELLELVNDKEVKKSSIRARPKKTSRPKKVSTANKELTELQNKIVSAQADNKFWNTFSSRPLADTAANRKKYKFLDELGICGKAGDEKLTAALKLLGAPSKKEVPVHKQAARAKARAKQDSDDESESETEIPAPKADDYLEDSDEDSGEDSDEAPVKPARKKKTSKRVVKKSQDSDEDSDEAPTKPARKKANKRVVKKSHDSDEDSGDEAPAKPARKKATPKKMVKKSHDSEDVDTVVKLSKLIDEGNAEVEEDTVKSPVKGKQPQARYNTKIKQWWNPQTKLVLKRKGIKSVVIGKVRGNEVVPLVAADLKKCKSLGWVTDTTELNKKEESDSASTSDSESE